MEVDTDEKAAKDEEQTKGCEDNQSIDEAVYDEPVPRRPTTAPPPSLPPELTRERVAENGFKNIPLEVVIHSTPVTTTSTPVTTTSKKCLFV